MNQEGVPRAVSHPHLSKGRRAFNSLARPGRIPCTTNDHREGNKILVAGENDCLWQYAFGSAKNAPI